MKQILQRERLCLGQGKTTETVWSLLQSSWTAIMHIYAFLTYTVIHKAKQAAVWHKDLALLHS